MKAILSGGENTYEPFVAVLVGRIDRILVVGNLNEDQKKVTYQLAVASKK